MNDTYIQVAFGLIPAVALFLILYFIQKTHKKRNLITAILFLICCTACFFGSLKVMANKSSDRQAPDLDKLSIIYAVADSGEPDQAVQMLTNLQETQVYDDSFTLCAARLYGMNGDYKASAVLYEKVMNSENETVIKEFEAVTFAAEDNKIDYVLSSYFDTGKQINSADNVTAADTAYKAISRAVKNSAGNDFIYSDAAASIVNTSELYNQFIDTGAFDKEQAEKQLELINLISKENQDLLTIPQFSIARSADADFM